MPLSNRINAAIFIADTRRFEDDEFDVKNVVEKLYLKDCQYSVHVVNTNNVQQIPDIIDQQILLIDTKLHLDQRRIDVADQERLKKALMAFKRQGANLARYEISPDQKIVDYVSHYLFMREPYDVTQTRMYELPKNI